MCLFDNKIERFTFFFFFFPLVSKLREGGKEKIGEIVRSNVRVSKFSLILFPFLF